MSDHINGAQSLVSTFCPLALYVQCASHCFNPVLNNASSVPEIRDMFSVVAAVTNFMNESPQLREIFKECFDAENTSRSLITLCPTRFVERHDALLIFHEEFLQIFEALEKIGLKSISRSEADTSRALLKAISEPTFIIALTCAQKVMALTISLSRLLQAQSQDLYQALQAVSHIDQTLKEWRTNETKKWDDKRYGPFTSAQRLADSIHISLDIPRLATWQMSRKAEPGTPI